MMSDFLASVHGMTDASITYCVLARAGVHSIYTGYALRTFMTICL